MGAWHPSRGINNSPAAHPPSHNNNSKLKLDNIGNGTLCRVKCIKLKNGTPPLQWKNWGSFNVYTTSARYVEWTEFERFPEIDKSDSKKYAIAKFENEMSPDDLEDNLS